MEKIVFIGTADYSKSIMYSLLEQLDDSQIAVIDNRSAVATDSFCGFKVYSNLSELDALVAEGYTQAFVAVKNNAERQKLTDEVMGHGLGLINIIDQTAILSNDIHIGQGVYIGKKVIIEPSCIIGDGVMINTGSVFRCDCKVGKFSCFDECVILAESANVGDMCSLGVRSIVERNGKVEDGRYVKVAEVVK